MISVKFTDIDFSKKMNGVVEYSDGFFQGIEMQKITFMKFLSGYIREALYKYIDSRSRMNPDALHHVYEPEMIGNKDGRLYQFDVVTTSELITFSGKFLPSKMPPLNSDQPFTNKAYVMENRIMITVSPKNSDVLVFENEGELVFTRQSIIVEHPGGDAVAGAFGEVVDQFFTQYLTNSLLQPIINDLKTADEFVKSFSSGSRAQGVRAGKKYLDITGVDFE